MFGSGADCAILLSASDGKRTTIFGLIVRAVVDEGRAVDAVEIAHVNGVAEPVVTHDAPGAMPMTC
jgi:hypothetical protein